MKQRDYIVVIIALLIGNIASLVGWNMSINDTAKYYNYYQTTEKFLDELDHHYDWVDAYDPEEYYEAVSKIHNN